MVPVGSWQHDLTSQQKEGKMKVLLQMNVQSKDNRWPSFPLDGFLKLLFYCEILSSMNSFCRDYLLILSWLRRGGKDKFHLQALTWTKYQEVTQISQAHKIVQIRTKTLFFSKICLHILQGETLTLSWLLMFYSIATLKYH